MRSALIPVIVGLRGRKRRFSIIKCLLVESRRSLFHRTNFRGWFWIQRDACFDLSLEMFFLCVRFRPDKDQSKVLLGFFLNPARDNREVAMFAIITE